MKKEKEDYKPRTFKKSDYVEGYGVYLGITQVHNYDGSEWAEHRFRSDEIEKPDNDFEGSNNMHIFKEIRTDDEKTLREIDSKRSSASDTPNSSRNGLSK